MSFRAFRPWRRRRRRVSKLNARIYTPSLEGTDWICSFIVPDRDNEYFEMLMKIETEEETFKEKYLNGLEFP